MKVPYRLRRCADSGKVAALLFCSEDMGELLTLISALGVQLWPTIYPVEGGFVLKVESLLEGRYPGTIRLRALAPDLLLPVDAELAPALFPDEAAGLVRERGLIFLPGGRILAYDPRRPLAAETVLELPERCRLPWQPLPALPERAVALREVLLERPEDQAEQILQAGGEDIAVEPPRPAEAGPVSGVAGSVRASLGNFFLRLGNLLGWRGLAGLGAGMIARALELVPRLSEALLGKQEAALRDLLREFREGDQESALRRALPMAGGPGRGSQEATNARLPTHNLRYSLDSLLADRRGPASLWFGGGNVLEDLKAEYRKAAQAAVARGDVRRAAFIYGKLLADYRQAADVLVRGGLHHDAAILYLQKLGDRAAAARAFEAGGEVDAALKLYRELGEHQKAGDLLRQLGEMDEALAEYLLAAEQLVRRDNHLAAAALLRDRADRLDLARDYLAAGWRLRPRANALPCLLRLLQLQVGDLPPADWLPLVAEGDTFCREQAGAVEAEGYYTELARLADTSALLFHPELRDGLRDRALLGLAAQLRQHAELGPRSPESVSALLGRSGLWPAAVVEDAETAFKAVAGPARSRPQPAGEKGVSRRSCGEGTITAACSAREAGTLFIGYETGRIVAFDPMHTVVHPIAAVGAPVRALSTDPAGKHLIALREGAEETLLLFARGETMPPYTLIHRLPLTGPSPSRLTPITELNGELLVGVWNQNGLTSLVGRQLSDSGLLSFQLADLQLEEVIGIYLGQGLGLGTVLSLFCYPDRVILWEHRLEKLVLLGRSILPAEDNLVPETCLCWTMDQAGQLFLELLRLDEEGRLYLTHVCSGCAVIQTARPGYRAATFTGPGRVAGVREDGIDWFKSGSDLASWEVRQLSLPGVLACFPSPLGELLIVCQNGLLVRVPVPR
jgi:tetratricopeptide (TPR) repeat protein